MEKSLFSMFLASARPAEIYEYLSHSSYDELLELNIEKNTFRALFHMENKYFMPLTSGKYLDLHSYALEHLVHPDDKALYASVMDPAGFYERLASAPLKGMIEVHYRIRALDRDWRWVEQVLLGGVEYGLPEGQVNCYILDIQTIKDRESGIYTVSSSREIRLDPLTGLLQRTDFFQEAKSLLAYLTTEWVMIAIDLENFKLSGRVISCGLH